MTPALAPRQGWSYLADYAQETLPRYTSYPPANRFDATVNATDAASAMRGLRPGEALSLYIHVPFCRKLCWYCGCNTSVPTLADPVEGYLVALAREIELVGASVTSDVCVTNIHIGGGSPDILTPQQVSALFRALRSSFHVSSCAEIAVELDPRGATDQVVDGFASIGLTRASLGVQVLDRSVQERINRVQSIESVDAVIRSLRRAGIGSLNIDMMYGLPGQTIEHVVETANFAGSRDADRLAVFGYAHVPWFKKHQKSIHTDDLPSGEQRFHQAEAAAQTLESAGYLPIGFDHFAAPGDSLVTADRRGELHRNFQGYTSDDTTALIGLGASSISSLPGLIWQNTPDTAAYRSSLGGGSIPVVRGARLSTEDRRIARLIERLLCELEADIPADLRIQARPRLLRMQAAGLIEFADSHLTITTRGRTYARNIAASFDPDFAGAAQKHSLAI